MNKKEFEIAERSYDIIKKAKEDLLELCNGQSVTLTLSILNACADYLTDSAKLIWKRENERKDGWDLIRYVLRKP